MPDEFIYWYRIYSANNWGIYVNWIFILVLDIFCQQLGDICKLDLYIAVDFLIFDYKEKARIIMYVYF